MQGISGKYYWQMSGASLPNGIKSGRVAIVSDLSKSNFDHIAKQSQSEPRRVGAGGGPTNRFELQTIQTTVLDVFADARTYQLQNKLFCRIQNLDIQRAEQGVARHGEADQNGDG